MEHADTIWIESACFDAAKELQLDLSRDPAAS